MQKLVAQYQGAVCTRTTMCNSRAQLWLRSGVLRPAVLEPRHDAVGSLCVEIAHTGISSALGLLACNIAASVVEGSCQ
jgi:hypothetical protein